MRLGRELWVNLVASLLIAVAVGIYQRNLAQGVAFGLIALLLAAVLVWVVHSGPVRSRLPHVSVIGRRGRPRADVTVSSGPSRDVRINITNRGPRADFHASAMVVANRHDPNTIRGGIYTVPWLGHTAKMVTLIPDENHSLLIARWQILEFPNPAPMMRMGEVEILERDGLQDAVWETFRWVFDPNGLSAEYDLDVTVFSTAASEPLVLKYTLKPGHWTGPLALVPRT